MDALAEDIAKVREHVRETIGEDPAQWTRWPGGWPGDIESALIDAVFSARAIYRSKRGRGISHKIADWQARRARSAFSLDALIAEIDGVGACAWASAFGSLQVSPGRRANAARGQSKAATVREAAGKLLEEGINIAAGIDSDIAGAAKTALRSVPGIGYATSNYFLMLLGVPGIKPDRMIRRFLKDATGHAFANAYAEQVLRAVATQLGIQEHELDHAIWQYERERASQ